MADIKKESELLAEIYRNTHYALVSISDILPETEDEALREELKKMHDGYERHFGQGGDLRAGQRHRTEGAEPRKKGDDVGFHQDEHDEGRFARPYCRG